ncbi:MAG: hypothetical protein RLZZ196_318 [Bacteroidota bacterium]|jgi:hypothetical protein
MFLNTKDILKINEILDKFPNVNTFELEQSNHSGIGSITTMSFDHEINTIKTRVSIEISGVEDW